jgi:molecular chaperone DnaJ
MGGLFASAVTCPSCQGSGKVIKHPCAQCRGTGVRQCQTTARVDVPAGSHDGDGVRVPGMGDAGRNGGASGDLQVEFEVPSEHLTPSQEQLATLAGVVAGVVLSMLFARTVLRLFSVLALPLFFVFFFWTPNFNKKQTGGFWKRVARRFVYGLVIGVFVFILLNTFTSCMHVGPW